MSQNRNRFAKTVLLSAPVVVMVLAAIAVPVEFRRPTYEFSGFSVDVPDFIANIAGFVPIGIALLPLGIVRGVICAALMSLFAETGQLVMMHRDPSMADVIANTLGGLLGVVVAQRWTIRPFAIRLRPWMGLLAAAAVPFLFFWTQANMSGLPNPRGFASPGMLEARWTFDEASGTAVFDASDHHIQGILNRDRLRGPGIESGAVTLAGPRDYVKFGHPMELRLQGSMTISAWIRSTSFPYDDAAIVSQLETDRGYQLDTTVDRKNRTIGFKLTNACGKLMARYGKTALAANRWYHVSGVYNSGSRRLDVYLDGRPDNGDLVGEVTEAQHSSRTNVYVGKRPGSGHFPFLGSIDDVRIYSFALTSEDIGTVMHGGVVENHRAPIRLPTLPPCSVISEHEDKDIPAAAVVLGAAIAVACIALLPTGNYVTFLALMLGLVVGWLLVHIPSAPLPSFNYVTVPLVSFAGTAAVVFSRRSDLGD